MKLIKIIMNKLVAEHRENQCISISCNRGIIQLFVKRQVDFVRTNTSGNLNHTKNLGKKSNKLSVHITLHLPIGRVKRVRPS